MTDEQRLERWCNWIELIKREIWELFYLHFIFTEVQTIITDNQLLSANPNYFFGWLRDVFAYSSSMYVRRQSDRRGDVISFYKLLDEIHRHPGLLTRGHFLKAWGYDETEGHFAHTAKRIGDELFDEAVGAGRNCLTKAQVKTDIDTLVNRVKLIEEYSKTFVAHRSQKPMASSLPTFKDLKDTMRFLESLLQKYYLLIKGLKMSDINIESALIDDWKGIFTFPWIRAEPIVGRERRERVSQDDWSGDA